MIFLLSVCISISIIVFPSVFGFCVGKEFIPLDFVLISDSIGIQFLVLVAMIYHVSHSIISRWHFLLRKILLSWLNH